MIRALRPRPADRCGSPRPLACSHSCSADFQSSVKRRFGRPVAGGGDERAEARDDEAARGLDAAVEIDRGDQRLEAVGENRVLLPAAGLLLAAAEQHEPAEVDLLGQPRQRRRRDDAGLDLRLVALAVRRKPRETACRP